ncbi:hypothetical protein [Streptomyces luteolus]|uniref:Uncharacterized protein n=1 Tax=Streptomyces luteolus TaxID=3043615 RepID=A0ABT6SYF4_9ACTN|nr:hypothetical protein [Streptomyces sp. B-S-A12]MDI3420647.1 hypothetical protein [Streptomyces sp. B-S-A12]
MAAGWAADSNGTVPRTGVAGAAGRPPRLVSYSRSTVLAVGAARVDVTADAGRGWLTVVDCAPGRGSLGLGVQGLIPRLESPRA